jgi:hypothetical protein
MSEPVLAGGRIEASTSTLVLAVGDTLAVLAFVVAGVVQHGGSPTDVVAVADAALPFLVGWAVAGTVFGRFRGADGSARETVVYTAGAWLVADLLGQGLRATPVFGGGFALPFLIVSLVVGGVLLVGWRLVAGRVYRRR